MIKQRFLPIILLLFSPACISETANPRESSINPEDTGIEATSLFGKSLFRPELPEETRRMYQENLEIARKNLDSNPDDPSALIWLGRRTAYLGHYGEAISIFSRGIGRFPDNPEFYRHRGHRYITTRKFDLAIADLEKAASLIEGQPDVVEQDGIPNARGIPTSTLQSNIWYHLGLAYYLKGDFESAVRCYRECIEVSGNNDMLVATTHWLYMSLRRSGRQEEALIVLDPIHSGMDIIENSSYFELLLMYKGVKDIDDFLQTSEGTPESAATAYGIGNWYLYNGKRDRAVEFFQGLVDGPGWASFGYIAAEADLARE